MAPIVGGSGMHLRRSFAALTGLLLAIGAAPRLQAQAQPAAGDAMAGGLMPGDYLRLGAGIISPVNPQGSLRDWNRGTSFSLVWENWQPASGGVSRVGFGIGVGYSLLPLNESQFVSDFRPISGGTTTSATASKAGILDVTTNIRIRIPAPIVMPSVAIGLGFIDWRPGDINYVSTTGSGTTKQEHRSGAEVSIGGGLDRDIVDRYAVFAEALYEYGFTSFGQGLANPGGTCVSNGCDILRNTTVGMIRGGLRVRVGR